MKRYLLFIILTFIVCNIGLFAQSNEVIARVSNLYTIKAAEDVETEDIDLITAPKEFDNNSNVNLDINFLRQFKKLKWVLRLGYDQSISRGETTLVRTDRYTNLMNNSKSRAFRIGIGIYHPVYVSSNKKAIFSFSFLGNYGYKFLDKFGYSNDLFDENDNYLGGSSKDFDYSNSWRISIELGSAFYYYFLPKIGIGMELNLGIYYDKLRGLTTQRQVIYDDKGAKVEEINSNHYENKTTIGKVNPVSLALSYRF